LEALKKNLSAMNSITGQLVARLRKISAFALLLFCLGGYQAGAATQTITLQPGWNAVWLTVDPTQPDPKDVFGSVPVTQVWCWFPTESPVEFIDNPASGLQNVDGWRCYLPPTAPDAILSNLAAVQGHRPYLIKLGGANNATLTIKGTTEFKPLKWRADSYNLVGFHVDPVLGGGATGAFFANADAHRQQSKHRLAASGEWTPMADSTPIRAGEAYWIFSKGPSHFDGPLDVLVDGGDFDFGALTQLKRVTLTNVSPFTNTVTLRANGFPIVVGTEGGGTTTWAAADTVSRTLPAGGRTVVQLGVQRANLSGPAAGEITITAPGVSFPFPASVAVNGQAPAGSLADRGARAQAAPAPTNSGLWVGSVALNKVNDVNNTAAGPVATPAQFNMRIIVHVDAGGQARLLKQVILMRKQEVAGALAPYALVTNDARLSDFTGATLKEGLPFGYRVSAIGYDFAGNELVLPGTFGSNLTGSVNVERSLTTNPMKHRYHPDHDDLDGQFRPLPDPPPANMTPDQEEVWKITRALQLNFDAAPSSDNPADADVRTGAYRETIAGLHKQALVVEGTFTLRRISPLAELNPAP
jgi:hypothetical protein